MNAAAATKALHLFGLRVVVDPDIFLVSTNNNATMSQLLLTGVDILKLYMGAGNE